MLGYERKIWETVGGIKTSYSGKAHLISGNSHWRKQTLVRHLYFKESPHSSAAIKRVKCSCSNQNPEEQREIPVRKDKGNKIHWGKKNLGYHIFKDSINRAMTSVKRWRDKIGHPILWWKKILNLCISSGARMIYVYLSSLFYKLWAILQSQIKLDSIYISFDLGNTFRTPSKVCWNHENTLLRYE